MTENKIVGGGEPKDTSKVAPNENQYQVVLPCSVEHFGSFVSGLLGKPQILRGETVGQFHVGYREIANAFNLVDHRVSQQNHGTLIHLAITVLYDNGTSVTHNDVERFKDYHPVERCRPIEVALDFTYLLSFPGRPAPEKQKIEVVFSTEPNENRARRRYIHGGLYLYKVEYTDRTWATDIAGLLGNHGKKLVEEHGKFKSYVRSRYEEIINFTGLLTFSIVLLLWARHSSKSLTMLSTSASGHTEFLLGVSNYFIGSVTALGLLGAFAYAVARFAQYSLYIPSKSHISLVDSDSEYVRKQTSLEKRRWLIAIGAWLSSIAAGLVVNYLNASGYFLP